VVKAAFLSKESLTACITSFKVLASTNPYVQHLSIVDNPVTKKLAKQMHELIDDRNPVMLRYSEGLVKILRENATLA